MRSVPPDVSGWARHSLRPACALDPPAHAGGTDLVAMGSFLFTLFKHRQNIPGRILEPRDVRARFTAVNTLFVSLDGFCVVLKPHATFGELGHRLIDIVDRKIENRKSSRRMVRL